MILVNPEFVLHRADIFGEALDVCRVIVGETQKASEGSDGLGELPLFDGHNPALEGLSFAVFQGESTKIDRPLKELSLFAGGYHFEFPQLVLDQANFLVMFQEKLLC